MEQMNWDEAKRIWVFPVAVYILLSITLVIVFTRIDSIYKLDDFARNTGEQILVFALYAAFLVTWYTIKKRYERHKKMQVRKSIRIFGIFFVCVYFVYTSFLLYDLIESLFFN